MIKLRLSVVRDADASGKNYDEVADPLTREELQQSAFVCDVLGTFFTKTDTPDSKIAFGSDVDNVMVSARYQVYLPSQEVLSWLASFPPPEDAIEQLEIGRVRFSSTERKASIAGTDQAPVKVHITDFIGKKTAVFGITRGGKSNTIKTLVAAIHKYASEQDKKIGQVIFDPQGEYANVNRQDGTGLRLLGDQDTVRIYRFGADGSDPQVRPLGMNFFAAANFDAATDFVNNAIMEQYGSYAYVKNYTSINWEEPPKSSMSEWIAWGRARVGFYGLLAMCGFSGSSFPGAGAGASGVPLEFTWKRDDFDKFEARHPGLVSAPTSGSVYRLRTPQAARQVTLFMADDGGWDTSSSNAKDVRPFGFISEVLNRASVKAAIRTLTDFHTDHSRQQVEEQVWDDMENGRLAIVDLAHGAGAVPRIISENIAHYILNQANMRFRSGQGNVDLQVVVEEAHNLFERGAKETSANPWLRLSKEAAKYDIGLIYATQEVTSVDQRILSNTSNWLIAHLNSDKETRELAGYYDFSVWSKSIKKSDDVGFVRMKTYSGKYIVPVQVAKFDHAMVNDARAAAGLDAWTVTIDDITSDDGDEVPPDSAMFDFGDGA